VGFNLGTSVVALAFTGSGSASANRLNCGQDRRCFRLYMDLRTSGKPQLKRRESFERAACRIVMYA
jgi:hypothetical protein